jgi:transcriptional regulator with XRE-family HTH domain
MRPDQGARQTVAEIVAANIRAYRHLRKMDQARLARRMQSLGFAWRRATVSELERDKRNVSLAEALALSFVLEVTIEDLLYQRPAGRGKPRLVFTDKTTEPDLPPGTVTALVSPHRAYAEVAWSDDDDFQGVTILSADADEDDPSGGLMFTKAKLGPTP